MFKLFLKCMSLALAATLAVGGATNAQGQVATVKVPYCLIMRDDTKLYVPCTGVVPIDRDTGNALKWTDLAVPVGTGGSPNASAVSVQGVPNGTAVATKLQDATGTALGTVANPLITDTLYRGSSVDKGGLFGTNSSVLMAANPLRRGMIIQVQTAGASCYINGLASATTDFHSLLIPANIPFENPTSYTGTGTVSIICTQPNTSVYARER